MPPTLTGPYAEPIDLLRNALAGLASFQTWTSSADQAEALEHVHVITADSESDSPYAIFDVGDNWQITRSELGQDGSNVFETRGAVRLKFRQSAAGNTGEVIAQFMSDVGAILGDLMDADADPVCVLQIIQEDPPMRTDPKSDNSQGSFVFQTLRIEYFRP